MIFRIIPTFSKRISGLIVILNFWIVITGLSTFECHADPLHKRIVSMSPAITEILFKIGAGDQVAGVTDFCIFPEEATKLPKLGGILNPNVEVMITLQPDLIIHHYDSLKIKDIAIKLGVDYLPVKLTNIKSILDSIDQIGHKTGFVDNAIKLRRKLESEITFYKKIVESRSTLTLFSVYP